MLERKPPDGPATAAPPARDVEIARTGRGPSRPAWPGAHARRFPGPFHGRALPRRGGFARALGRPTPAPMAPAMLLWTRSRKFSAKTNGLTAFLDEGSEMEGRYTFSGVALLNG